MKFWLSSLKRQLLPTSMLACKTNDFFSVTTMRKGLFGWRHSSCIYCWMLAVILLLISRMNTKLTGFGGCVLIQRKNHHKNLNYSHSAVFYVAFGCYSYRFLPCCNRKNPLVALARSRMVLLPMTDQNLNPKSTFSLTWRGVLDTSQGKENSATYGCFLMCLQKVHNIATIADTWAG